MKKILLVLPLALLFLAGCSDEVNTQDVREFSYTNQWGEVMHCITVDANTHYAMMGCVNATNATPTPTR